MTTSQEASQETAMIEVTSLDDFIPVLVNWHNLRVARLKHLLDTPEGVSVTMDNAEELELTGDTLKGFTLGVQIALHQLGQLPFVFETEEDE